MTVGQNLTPDEWSKVLESDGLAQAVAKNVAEDRTFPWTPTLIDLTQDCESTLDMGSGRGESRTPCFLSQYSILGTCH